MACRKHFLKSICKMKSKPPFLWKFLILTKTDKKHKQELQDAKNGIFQWKNVVQNSISALGLKINKAILVIGHFISAPSPLTCSPCSCFEAELNGQRPLDSLRTKYVEEPWAPIYCFRPVARRYGGWTCLQPAGMGVMQRLKSPRPVAPCGSSRA